MFHFMSKITLIFYLFMAFSGQVAIFLGNRYPGANSRVAIRVAIATLLKYSLSVIEFMEWVSDGANYKIISPFMLKLNELREQQHP